MLRRDMLLFGRGLIPALLLTSLLFLGSALAGYSVLQGTEQTAASVQVAVVDEEGGTVSRFCINLIDNQEVVSALMDMEFCEKTAALEGLAEGRYAAVIVLPDGYTSQIRYGKSGEGQIFLSRSAAASAEVIAQVAALGEQMIAAGQNAVFAGEDVARQSGLETEAYQRFLLLSNQRLLDATLSLYENSTRVDVGSYGQSGLTPIAYYAAAWLSLLVMLCGLFFFSLYAADNRRELMARLFSEGITPSAYLKGKVLFPFLFRIPLLALALLPLNRFVPLQWTPAALLCALFGVLTASAFISFSAVALASRQGWVGLLLGFLLLCHFLCGGLLPRNLLPQALPWLGELTPSGCLMGCMSPLFGASVKLLPLLLSVLWAAASFALALRHLRQLPFEGESA